MSSRTCEPTDDKREDERREEISFTTRQRTVSVWPSNVNLHAHFDQVWLMEMLHTCSNKTSFFPSTWSNGDVFLPWYFDHSIRWLNELRRFHRHVNIWHFGNDRRAWWSRWSCSCPTCKTEKRRSSTDRSSRSLHFDRSVGTTADDRLTIELDTGDAWEKRTSRKTSRTNELDAPSAWPWYVFTSHRPLNQRDLKRNRSIKIVFH